MPIINPNTIDLNDSASLKKLLGASMNVKEFYAMPELTGSGKKTGLLSEKYNHLPDNYYDLYKKTFNNLNGNAKTIDSYMNQKLPKNKFEIDIDHKKELTIRQRMLDLTHYHDLLKYVSDFFISDSRYEKFENSHELLDNDDMNISFRLSPYWLKSVHINKPSTAGSGTISNFKTPFVDFNLELKIINKKNKQTSDKIRFINEGNISHHKIDKTRIFIDSCRDHIGLKIALEDIFEPDTNLLSQIKPEINKYVKNFEIHQAINNLKEFQLNNFESYAIEYFQNTLDVLEKKHKNNKIHKIFIKDILCQIIDRWDKAQDFKKKELLSNKLLVKLLTILKTHSIAKILGNNEMNSIYDQSLRFFLADKLSVLQNMKKNNILHKSSFTNQSVKEAYQKSPDYSQQQKNIILSEDPLIIGYAGAGSGKSHTVVGRIKYLQDQGVDLSTVGIFSFTNASADNIKARFPKIQSETLANMFNNIYAETYPSQILSEPSTLHNTLKLLDVNHPMFANHNDKKKLKKIISDFAEIIKDFDQQGYKKVNYQEKFKELNNFLKKHIEITVLVLNACEQTTLELQPAILHYHLQNNWNNVKVPKKYTKFDYLITDESQDISTFEHIVLMEFVIEFKSELLIVGDGSQTLYEFRNSDPRYLSALESSNIFESKKLDTNYRSNQEILDFANEFLESISANEKAQIRLKSNNFKPVTLDSFHEKVKTFDVIPATYKWEDIGIAIKRTLENKDFENYILNAIAKNEQIAFLAPTKKNTRHAEKAIRQILAKHNLQNKKIVSLITPRAKPYTIMSNILTQIDLENVPTGANHKDFVIKLFKNKVRTRKEDIKQKMKNYVKMFLDNIMNTTEYQTLLYDAHQKNISMKIYKSYFTKLIINKEIRNNSVRNYLKRSENKKDLIKDADIVLSTIHSAKGLEFPHVIAIHNNISNNAHTQETLRLNFVAFSRAIKDEYIINLTKDGPINYTINVQNSNIRSGMFVDPINYAYRKVEDRL